MTVSREQALLAIVDWMGTYEGASGDTIDSMDRDGYTDEDIIGNDVPEDIVAGYRLALKQYREAHRARVKRELMAETTAKYPTASKARIKAAVEAVMAR